METLNYIASLFGFSLVVIPLSLLVNPKNLARLSSHVEDGSNSFVWGIISFILGSAMLLNHNVWVSDWTVIITILGWLVFLKGVMLLFWPDVIKTRVQKVIKSQQLSVLLVIVVFIGLTLTYFAFTA